MEPQTRSVGGDKISQMNSIFHEIQTLYDAGYPIFTKDNIRKVGEELEQFRTGERNSGNVIIKGVNGVDYEIFVQSPSLGPPRPNQILGGSKWVIFYYSIESLTTFKLPDLRLFNPQLAYLPMQIRSPIRLRLGYNVPIDEEPLLLPTEEYFRMYQTIEEQWKMSPYYVQLEEILSSIKIPFALTKVIALALGSLVVRSQINKRSFLQHALISAIHSTLVRRSILSASSEKYVQDPGYTQRDKDIIHSAGLTVLDDPQALLELDESSVLVSIAANIPVADIVADTCRPGIIIWSDRARSGLTLNHRVKKMIQNEYTEMSFPHHEECFGNLKMVLLLRKST
ncbi:hypothetical protein F5Y14DRAFT_427654 [Nemania sp. NC0429]|nr:hypothetical protein F5Y14DRAFT_427654 [Nemania sp. NC0429]